MTVHPNSDARLDYVMCYRLARRLVNLSYEYRRLSRYYYVRSTRFYQDRDLTRVMADMKHAARLWMAFPALVRRAALRSARQRLHGENLPSVRVVAAFRMRGLYHCGMPIPF